MKTQHTLVHLLNFAVLTLGACKSSSDSPPAHPPSGRNNATQTTKAAEDRNNAHAPGERGHEHDEGEALGTTSIGGLQVRVVQHGKVVPGKEGEFDVFVSAGTPSPAAVRLWIGSQDGREAIKLKATINKEEAHNHVEVPDPLPPDAKLWIEIELPGGAKVAGSLEIKR